MRYLICALCCLLCIQSECTLDALPPFDFLLQPDEGDLVGGINAGEPSGVLIPENGEPVSVRVISESSVAATVTLQLRVVDEEVHRAQLTVAPFETAGLIGPDIASVIDIRGSYAGSFGATPPAFLVLGRDYVANDIVEYIIPDPLDECPADRTKFFAGFCGCGVPETDSDSDGTPDCVDACAADPDKTAPGPCGCGVPETDSDADGTPDCDDLCPDDPEKIEPGACGCGDIDFDSDQDGTFDCNDRCPFDPDKILPGPCGCGESDADRNNNGMPDCRDEPAEPTDDCPEDPEKTQPGLCGCGVPEDIGDSDEDGIINCLDHCPHDYYNDIDEDEICGDVDNCPFTWNPGQEDEDQDTIGDACDESEMSTVVSRRYNRFEDQYDIALPIAECPASEPRRGGVQHLIFTFADDVYYSGESYSCEYVWLSAGYCDGAYISENAVHVYIDDLPDNTLLTAVLFNLRDGEGRLLNPPPGIDVAVLSGDVNGDRVVDDTDADLIRDHLYVPVTQQNFRCDLTLDGLINVADLNVVKLNLGASVSCDPPDTQSYDR